MKPNFAIIGERIEGGFTSLFIDLDKATVRGRKLQEGGKERKRKFENLLIIKRPKERLKFTYKI